jgi:hypothetical protein
MMDGFSVDTRLTIDDWRAYQRAFQQRVLTDQRPLRTWVFVFAASLLLGFLGAAFLQYSRYPVHAWEIIAGMVIAYGSIILRSRSAHRAALPSEDGVILGATHYEFRSDGIHQHRAQARIHVAWNALQGISETPQYVYLWIDRLTAYIVPVRDLPAGMDAAQAVATVRALAAGATNASGASSTTPESSSASMLPGSGASSAADAARARANAASAGNPTLLASLRDALKVYAHVPLRQGIVVHQGATFLLGVAGIVLWIVLDGMAQDQPTEFSVLGFAGIGCYVLAALAVAWFIALRIELARAMRNTVWIVAVLAPLVVTGTWLASFKDPPWSTLILGATALLAVIDVTRVLRAMTGYAHLRAVAGGLAASVLLWMMLGASLISATVWYPMDLGDAQEAPTSDVDIEGSLYEQPARIDSALAAVAPHTGTAPQAYMLGFAGVGEQRVFAEEIKLAAGVLGQRYGTAQRSLLLINDERDLDSHPLATVTALGRSLRGMARRMNPDEDILFLVLSSHGSQDASIAVSNGGMELNPLDADALADALQDSGIRYKVIIISACYAGGFIPALSDENTVILAAAAADRTSFGCGSDRDLTYFGEAFFRDALPGAASLRAAFSLAASALAQRERAEHETPSKPQAYYGAAIMAHLEGLEPSHVHRPDVPRTPLPAPQLTVRALR